MEQIYCFTPFLIQILRRVFGFGAAGKEIKLPSLYYMLSLFMILCSCSEHAASESRSGEFAPDDQCWLKKKKFENDKLNVYKLDKNISYVIFNNDFSDISFVKMNYGCGDAKLKLVQDSVFEIENDQERLNNIVNHNYSLLENQLNKVNTIDYSKDLPFVGFSRECQFVIDNKLKSSLELSRHLHQKTNIPVALGVDKGRVGYFLMYNECRKSKEVSRAVKRFL